MFLWTPQGSALILFSCPLSIFPFIHSFIHSRYILFQDTKSLLPWLQELFPSEAWEPNFRALIKVPQWSIWVHHFPCSPFPLHLCLEINATAWLLWIGPEAHTLQSPSGTRVFKAQAWWHLCFLETGSSLDLNPVAAEATFTGEGSQHILVSQWLLSALLMFNEY